MDVGLAVRAGFAEPDITAFLSAMSYAAPTHPASSAQWALARDGIVVMSGAFGPAPPDSLFLIFSAGKPLTSTVVLQLVADGALSLDDSVAHVLPGFGDHGKDQIQLRHLLSHGAGIPSAVMTAEQFASLETRRAAYRDWEIEWAPGTRFAYHHVGASWVLADIIEEVTRADYRLTAQAQADSIAEGIRIGGPSAAAATVVPVTCIDPTGATTNSTLPGLPTLSELNGASFRAAGHPAGGVIASAVSIAGFYQRVLAWRADGSPPPYRRATSEIENAHVDPRFGAPANWGLGFAIAGPDPSYLRAVFGPLANSTVFGHNGTGGQVCWADPASGVSFCYLTNELDSDVRRAHRRWTMASAAATALAGAARSTA